MKSTAFLSFVSLFVFALMLGLEACTSVEVAADEDDLGGTIIYNPEGADDLVQARRRDVEGRMEDFCGEKGYSITKKERRKRKNGEGTASLGGTIAVLGAQEIMSVHFRCKSN